MINVLITIKKKGRKEVGREGRKEEKEKKRKGMKREKNKECIVCSKQ